MSKNLLILVFPKDHFVVADMKKLFEKDSVWVKSYGDVLGVLLSTNNVEDGEWIDSARNIAKQAAAKTSGATIIYGKEHSLREPWWEHEDESQDELLNHFMENLVRVPSACMPWKISLTVFTKSALPGRALSEAAARGS